MDKKTYSGVNMAKETKQERIVRGMIDQIIEHIHELKSLEANTSIKELDVERWCQSVLRNCLGYTASAGYSIRAQESKGKMRPDLIVLKGDKPVFVVEVKKLGFDLNRSDFRSGKIQLKEYLQNIGDVRWGILSNGYEWKLFDFSNPAAGGIEIAAMDVHGENETLDGGKKTCEEVAWSWIDMHESSFSSNSWPELAKEATAFSPESLTRAILSAEAMKIIARTIRGEHEYKANTEILTDRVYNLLELGLNDAIAGWNDNKRAEYQKYIKSQKRISRRTRKSSQKPESAATAEAPHQSDTTTTPETLAVRNSDPNHSAA
jgi:hypothetical protein